MDKTNPTAYKLNVLASFAHEVLMGAIRPEALEENAREALKRADLLSLASVVALCDVKPPRDAGPWRAARWVDGRVVVASDDFTHDVALVVSGDFATSEDKLAYAQELANQLNVPMALSYADHEQAWERLLQTTIPPMSQPAVRRFYFEAGLREGCKSQAEDEKAFCPSCGVSRSQVSCQARREEIPYGSTGASVSVVLPVHTCANCGMAWTDHQAEVLREFAVNEAISLERCDLKEAAQAPTVTQEPTERQAAQPATGGE